MIRKRLLAMLAAIAILLGLGVVQAAPASAYWDDCPAGQMCMWSGYNGQGTMHNCGFSAHGSGNGQCNNVPFAILDAASSVLVSYGSGYDVRYYTDVNCTGSYMTIYSPNGATMNDALYLSFDNTLAAFRIWR
jgi:hypothetical protein